MSKASTTAAVPSLGNGIVVAKPDDAAPRSVAVHETITVNWFADALEDRTFPIYAPANTIKQPVSHRTWSELKPATAFT
jgi:hypothetical protein